MTDKGTAFRDAFEAAKAAGTPMTDLYDLTAAVAFADKMNGQIQEYRDNPPRSGNRDLAGTERARGIQRLTVEINKEVRNAHTAARGRAEVLKDRCANLNAAEAQEKAKALPGVLDELVDRDDAHVLRVASDLCANMNAGRRAEGEVVAAELRRRGLSDAAQKLDAAIFDSRFAYKLDPGYLAAQDTLRRADEWLATASTDDVLLEVTHDGKAYTAKASDLIR